MRHVHLVRIGIVLLSAACTTGCGPMFLPLSVRVSPEDQGQIDAAWDNMLTPVNRVGRDTVLDTLLVYWLYQTGVDRLRLVSEKYLSHGKVIMEADCDRASPDTDQFTLTVLDERGRTVRRERYARCEIEQRAKVLWNFDPNSIGLSIANPPDRRTTRPTSQPVDGRPTTTASTADQENARIERDRRMKAIEAATRPARIDTDR